MVEALTVRLVAPVYVALPSCVSSPKWGAKSQQPPLLGGVAASSTRRTLPAEQLVIVEPIIETAPLFSSASTTPPSCGCEERDWRQNPPVHRRDGTASRPRLPCLRRIACPDDGDT